MKRLFSNAPKISVAIMATVILFISSPLSYFLWVSNVLSTLLIIRFYDFNYVLIWLSVSLTEFMLTFLLVLLVGSLYKSGNSK